MSDHRTLKAAKAREIAMLDRQETSLAAEPSGARIRDQLGYMQENISVSFTMVQELISRLEPILLPELEQKGTSDKPDSPEFRDSLISRTIDDYNGQLNQLHRLIGDTIERLQL